MCKIINNKDGSITTTKSDLRCVFIYKILNELPIDMNEELEQKMTDIIQKAVGDIGRFDTITISKDKKDTMLLEIDELIKSYK